LFIGLVEKMADFLQNGHCIGFFLWVLPQVNKLIKQLIDIGHIEVPGQDQVAGHPVVLAQEGVAGFNGIAAIGPVAQMSKENFSGKRQIILQPFNVLQALGMTPHAFENALLYFLKDIVYGIVLYTSAEADITLTRSHVEFVVGHPGAFLTAVVLLIHQVIPLVQTIQSLSVYFL